jgi:hypothetical protein
MAFWVKKCRYTYKLDDGGVMIRAMYPEFNPKLSRWPYGKKCRYT